MRTTVGILVLCSGLAAVGCQHTAKSSSADVDGGRSAQRGNSMATTVDNQFFMDAAAGGTYEVQSSQIELKNGSSAQAKQIAQQMVTDHTKANTELLALARSKGSNITPAPNQMQQDMLTKLNGLNGAALDTEYLHQQQMAHQDTISKFQAATQNTSQPVAAWASKTLPTLQGHLSMINQALGQGGNGMGAMR